MKYIKNYKSLFTVLLIILPFVTIMAQVRNQVTIHGKISNNTFTTATLYKFGQQLTEIQKSTLSAEGEFTMVQEINGTDFYKLEFTKDNFIMLILKLL